MEGVGNEVLCTVGVLIATSIFIICYFLRRRVEEEPLDIDEDRPPIYNPNLCPICWSSQSLGLETNCGHLYCGPCFKTYYNQNIVIGTSGVDCPLCRQKVGILFLCYTLEERTLTGNEATTRQEITAFARRYNRMMSNTLTFADTISEIPVLLRHLVAELLAGDNFIRIVRFRIFLYAFAMVLYVVAPYDIFPEIVYGLYGYIEDIFAIIVFIYYLCRFYRNFLAGDH